MASFPVDDKYLIFEEDYTILTDKDGTRAVYLPSKKSIRAWAESWIDYWADYDNFCRAVCSWHSGQIEKNEIARYQTVLDALDGKLEMPPEKTWR